MRNFQFEADTAANRDEALSILIKLGDATEDYTMAKAGRVSGFPVDGERLSASELGGWLPRFIIGLAKEEGHPILQWEDDLYIWGTNSYLPIKARDLRELEYAAATGLGLKAKGMLVEAYRKESTASYETFSPLAEQFGVKAPVSGIQFKDAFVYLDVHTGKLVAKPGANYTHFNNFSMPCTWEQAKNAAIDSWDMVMQTQRFDKRERQYIEATLGNVLLADPLNAQRALLLVGQGGSGKSSIMDTLGYIAGTHNVVTYQKLDEITKGDAKAAYPMAFRLVAQVDDSNAKMQDISKIKSIISKGTIKLRRLYKEAEEITPRASIVLASNDMGIAYRLGDSGVSRRFDIISFKYKPSNKLSNLHELLYAERCGIAAKLLLSLEAEVKQNASSGRYEFQRPEWLERAVEDIALDQDVYQASMARLGLCKPSKETNVTYTNAKLKESNGVIGIRVKELNEQLKADLEHDGFKGALDGNSLGRRYEELGMTKLDKKLKGYAFRLVKVYDEELFNQHFSGYTTNFWAPFNEGIL